MLALFHGGDAALADERVNRAITMARQADPDVEISRYDGEIISPHALAGALSTFSLFSSARLVVITGVAARVPKEELLRATLESCLSALPPGLDVLFRERRELPDSHPLVALIRGVQGTVTAGGRLDRRDFAAKLLEVARAQDIRLSEQGAGLLADRCVGEVTIDGRAQVGPDLVRGRTELQKLAAYVGRGITIDEAAVKLLVEEPLERVFALTDALAERRLGRANAVLEHLLSLGEAPQVLLANVIRQFRLLLLYVSGQRERGDVAFLRTGEFRLRDFQLRALSRQAPSFTYERLCELMDLFVRADEAVKTGKLDAEEALRLLAASICTGSDLLPSSII